jgi:protein-S-isoprenylcysteine O-methyltransferase Ste14
MLTLRSIFWTLLLPGTMTVVIPYSILQENGARIVVNWHLLGIGPIGAGAWILLSCVWHFQTSGHGTLAPVDPPKFLVIRGLYHYVRNPMYFGIVMILLGETLVFWSAGILWYSFIFIIIANLFIRFVEEPNLERQFGEPYREYCRSVHRWIPRFRK